MPLDKEEEYKTKCVKNKLQQKNSNEVMRLLNGFFDYSQKLIAVLIVTLNIVIIRADISLKLSAANQFEGYSYPKPKTPFFTGNLKNFEPETTTR